jgi:acyl transferase domain-containing protein/thioesterase domain-containing protein/acyl carrier protein
MVSEPGLAERLAKASADDRLRTMLDLVLAKTAELLGQPPSAIDPRRPYLDYGYNSLAAVELTDQLSRAIGLELPLTMLFDHPTPDAVASYLLSRLDLPAAEPAAEPVAEPATREQPGLETEDDAVVVVGASCRYPGHADTPAALWRLAAEGRDSVSGFPADRGWPLDELYHPDPDHPDTAYTRCGGFVPGAADFDADFFGISPREALAMDPQQRLLLEGAWEVFEDAGIDPESLQGSRTGVFVGISGADYSYLAHASADRLQGYWGIGTLPAIASGRVAYKFGFEGPALTVDTACSSSLVAVHLAMQSLRRGECSLALAGGATVMATPNVFIEFSRQRALSPDGRCRSYADSADGTGWSEGMGMVLLERMSDARRCGHRVLAVLRGSAVNQDGASNGMTAPNGPSQERVIRAALADAGVRAADVDAVEGHGTATVLGDPIEAQALLAAYGRDRPAGRPLWLGSLKSNIGHSQAAAGVGGLIKMIMALREETLPATLHADRPTAKVDWSSGAVRLLGRSRPWPRGDRPRLAGVSSFGASGTNAHVIVEEAPACQPEQPGPGGPGDPGGPVAWVLSGRMPSGLRAQARRLREWVTERPGLSPLDVGYSLATTRAQLSHRAVVIGTSRTDLLTKLDTITNGDPAGVVDASTQTGSIAFVVPAPHSQPTGMAAGLMGSAPAFAGQIRECARALRPHITWDLLDVINRAPGAPAIEDPAIFGPAFFAIQVALAALWRSHGVVPDAVIPEPGGELAAAVIAGTRTLDNAVAAVAGTPSGGGARSGDSLAEGIRVSAEQGSRAFIEISTSPSLADAVAKAVIAAGGDLREFLITRQPDGDPDEVASFPLMLAQANVGGVRVDWSPLFAGRGARAVELPTYPFQRQRYWIEAPASRAPQPDHAPAEGRAPRPAAGEERRSGTLTALLYRAHAENAIPEAIPMLASASRFRPSFSSTAELNGSRGSVLVAEGAPAPTVICVPSFLAGSGPHQFARLGMGFRPPVRTSALFLPGFGKSDPLPATWKVAVEAMADATLAAASGQPFVLVGHSVGGQTAQAIAEHLEKAGKPPQGVIMVDTYDIDGMERETLLDWAMASIFDRDPTGAVVNDDNLLAMGAYLRLFGEWSPIGVKAPTLAVRAAAADAAAALNAPAKREWKPADVSESVLADHFSILEDKAVLAARVIGEWLPRLSKGRKEELA